MEDEYSDEDDEDDYGDTWVDHSRVGWDDDDQNWALCDKDCGWCGNCTDGLDY
jgi:hypothetical protein